MHFSSGYWIFSLNEPIRMNDYRYESDMHAFIWSNLWVLRVLIFAQPMGKAPSDNLGLSVFGYPRVANRAGPIPTLSCGNAHRS